jgi:hypothetical protein
LEVIGQSETRRPIWVVGEVPNFVLIGILIFMILRSPCKNLKPYNNPFVVLNSGSKKKKKKKKWPPSFIPTALHSDQNSGRLRLCQQPRAAHGLHSDQKKNIPKMVATIVYASSARTLLGPIIINKNHFFVLFEFSKKGLS